MNKLKCLVNLIFLLVDNLSHFTTIKPLSTRLTKNPARKKSKTIYLHQFSFNHYPFSNHRLLQPTYTKPPHLALLKSYATATQCQTLVASLRAHPTQTNSPNPNPNLHLRKLPRWRLVARQIRYRDRFRIRSSYLPRSSSSIPNSTSFLIFLKVARLYAAKVICPSSTTNQFNLQI